MMAMKWHSCFMIGFEFSAFLSDQEGRPIRPITIAVSAPRLLDDGRYACRVDCSEPGISRNVVSDFSELAYNRALSRVRYLLMERNQWLMDNERRWLSLDPPRMYRVQHQGYRWPDRGTYRSAFPRVSFVGDLIAKTGKRTPYAIRIGSPRPDRQRRRYSCSLYYSGTLDRLWLFGDWIDEAYSYAFRRARMDVNFHREHGLGEFVDREGRPIKVTAPLIADANAEAISA